MGYIPNRYLVGGEGNTDALNIIYNLADLVNKTAFGFVIWAAAVKTQDNRSELIGFVKGRAYPDLHNPSNLNIKL